MLLEKEIKIGITLFDSLRNKEIILSKKHLCEFLIDEKSFYLRYIPINISDEKLLSIGFVEKFETSNSLEFKKVSTKLELVKIKDRNIYIVFWNSGKICEIKYLHQYENISNILFSS